MAQIRYVGGLLPGVWANPDGYPAVFFQQGLDVTVAVAYLELLLNPSFAPADAEADDYVPAAQRSYGPIEARDDGALFRVGDRSTQLPVATKAELEPDSGVTFTATAAPSTLDANGSGSRYSAMRFAPASIPGLDVRLQADDADASVFGYDTFARANGASLGTADDGKTWTTHNGSIAIISGRAAQTTPGAAAVASFAADVVECTVDVGINVPASGDMDVSAYIRFIDASNYYRLRCRKTSAPLNRIELIRCVSGTETVVATYNLTAPAFVAGAMADVSVQVSNTTYTTTIGGAAQGSVTDASSPAYSYPPTHVRAGLGFSAGDTGTSFEYIAASGNRFVKGDTVPGLANLAQPTNPARADARSHAATFEYGVASRSVLRFPTAVGVYYRTSWPADVWTSTYAFVIKPGQNSTPSARTLFGTDTTGGLIVRLTTAGYVELVSRNTAVLWTSDVPVPDGESSIITVQLYATGDIVVSINGKPGGYGKVTVPTLAAGAKVQMFGHASGGGAIETFAGDVHDVFRWTRVLTGAELRRVIDSLASRYSIPMRSRPGGLTTPLRLDRRLRGSNFHPNATQNTSGAWKKVWGPNWDWDWVKLNIDKAKASGANAFRMIGDLGGVIDGTTVQATYLARQQQVADYLASQDMLYYAVVGDWAPGHRGNSSFAQMTALAVALAQALADRPNVFALEMAQEFNGSVLPESVTYSYVREMARQIRAVAPNIPLSVSNAQRIRSSSGNYQLQAGMSVETLVRLEDCVDFFDVHPYTYMTPTFDATTLQGLLLFTDKPVLFGEFGSDRTSDGLSSGARAALFATIGDAVQSGGHRMIGAFQWAACNDGFGLWSADGATQKTDIAAAFAAWPSTFA